MERDGMLLVTGCECAGLPEGVPVIYADRLRLVDCPECVVMVGENAEIPQVRSALGVVVSGDGGGAFPAERLSGIQVITCGRCGKNTICITSDDGDTVTLALNRTVTTLSGICEPMELPVKRQPDFQEYPCMAAFAAAILLGRVE